MLCQFYSSAFSVADYCGSISDCLFHASTKMHCQRKTRLPLSPQKRRNYSCFKVIVRLFWDHMLNCPNLIGQCLLLSSSVLVRPCEILLCTRIMIHILKQLFAFRVHLVCLENTNPADATTFFSKQNQEMTARKLVFETSGGAWQVSDRFITNMKRRPFEFSIFNSTHCRHKAYERAL